MSAINVVLLGIRSAVKEDIQCTTSELVYGTTLRLPGELCFQRVHEAPVDMTTYVEQLRTAMSKLVATPPRQPRGERIFIYPHLHTCSHVFVRRLAVKHPLACRYDGSYRVVRRAAKFYTLDIKGKSDTVSIDRLKPAYIDAPADKVPGQFMQLSKSESISIEIDSRHVEQHEENIPLLP